MHRPCHRTHYVSWRAESTAPVVTGMSLLSLLVPTFADPPAAPPAAAHSAAGPAARAHSAAPGPAAPGPPGPGPAPAAPLPVLLFLTSRCGFPLTLRSACAELGGFWGPRGARSEH